MKLPKKNKKILTLVVAIITIIVMGISIYAISNPDFSFDPRSWAAQKATKKSTRATKMPCLICKAGRCVEPDKGTYRKDGIVVGCKSRYNECDKDLDCKIKKAAPTATPSATVSPEPEE